MQRPRKVLQQRRATSSKVGILSRKHLYFKTSLLFLSWGVFFFLFSLINKGSIYRGVLGALVEDSNRYQAPADSCTSSMSDDALAMSKSIPTYDVQEIPSSGSHTVRQAHGDYVGDDNESNIPPSPGKDFNAKEIPSLNVKTASTTPSQKNGRISRVAPGLDEFKSKAFTAKERSTTSQTGTVVHRVEPNGREYNYASSAKGAKVLAFNKEAKGASNILDKDNDKYLRNPCSAEEKYVVIELSEETLVDSFEIVNFEHYSSNLKDFELLSSLVYPTDSWVKLGNFTAQNMKHAQRFILPEPKWARYLKLSLLSHYGSEFYCTLSIVEVYGVDAVERMMEDLISVENKKQELEEQIFEQIPIQALKDEEHLHEELLPETDYVLKKESSNAKASRESVVDSVESRPSLVGRMPGDTVLKTLMQKVQSLDVNFSILELYLEELNSRYGHTFKELDDDIGKKDALLEKVGLQINNLQKDRDMIANEIDDLLSWKFAVTSQLDHLVKQSDVLRLEIEVIRNHEVDVENRGLLVIFVSFILGCVASCKLFMDMFIFICRGHDSENFCRTSYAWLVLLFSSSVIIIILVV